MDYVLRTAAVYGFLVLVFRIAGKRSLKDATTFDFVLLLVISESTQQALVGEDYSLTTALVVITTFVIIDIALSVLKQRSPRVEKLLDGVPLIIVENGTPLADRMRKTRTDDEDVLEAARELRGLERMDQIKYAVLERSGKISIVPKN